MTENAMTTSRESASPRWLTGLITGLAGLFYAYAMWNAVAHLIAMAQSGLTGVGWITLLFGVVFPAIVFVFAYAIGRRRRAGELALVLIAGLGIVAVFWLSLIGYSILNMGDLVSVTL
jgi:dolichyl-phosphate-mannose--protein O-mannosyl transferase